MVNEQLLLIVSSFLNLDPINIKKIDKNTEKVDSEKNLF